jgi:tetratricopeptide (TPR) repeat protein
VHGSTTEEKNGGILALRELISCSSADTEQKVMKFANTLSTALKINTDYDLLQIIAKAFGLIAKVSPIARVDIVECELNRSLEWLRTDQAHRRFAACAVLQQLAENTPTVFFAKTKEFFDLIWGPLWDSKDKIRHVAAKALCACLALLNQRTYYVEWYHTIYSQILEGLKKGTQESVHGSLLIVAETLRCTGDYMVPRFKEICSAILQLRDHRSRTVRSEIIGLIPVLAQFSPDSFARHYLNNALDMLMKCSRHVELKPRALTSLGKLCLAVGYHLVSRVDELVTTVRDSLISTSGKSEVAPEALRCIADMVQSLGSPFHERILGLLDLLFQSGLTVDLIHTLTVLVRFVPQQTADIQNRLLEETTKILGGDSRAVALEPEYVYCWSRSGHRPPKSIVKLSNIRSSDELLYHHGVSRTTSDIQSASFLHQDISNSGSSTPASAGGSIRGSLLPPSTPQSTLLGKNKHWEKGSFSMGAGAVPSSPGPGITSSMSLTSSLALSSNTSAAAALASAAAAGPAHQTASPMRKQSFLSSVKKGFVGLATGSVKTSKAQHQSQFIEKAVTKDSPLVILCLRTLGSLTLSGEVPMRLVQQSVLPYLDSDDARVRREAAVTCSKMISTAMNKDTSVVVGQLIKVTSADDLLGVHVHSEGWSQISADNQITPRSAIGVAHSPRGARRDPYSVDHTDLESGFGGRSTSIMSDNAAKFSQLIEFANYKTSSSEQQLFTKGPTATTINHILTRLLQVVVTDPSSAVRLPCLQILMYSPEYTRYLSQTQHIQSILYLLSDENFEIRLDALCILGQLAAHNPSAIIPQLRLMLVRLIQEIISTNENRVKEDAIRMLSQFLRSTSLHIIVRPYVGTIIELLPLSGDVRLSSAALCTVSELCRVMKQDFNAYSEPLFPILMDFIAEPSSRKRQETAIRTLGDVVSATGLAVVPYLRFPQLLPNLLELLFKTSQNTPWSLRMETLRTLGLLGALEARKYVLITNHLKQLDKQHMEKIALSIVPTGGAEEATARDRADSAASVTQLQINRSEISLEDENADAPAHLSMYGQCMMNSLHEPSDREEQRRTPADEDYYPVVAITALMKIMRDKTLQTLHSAVAHAIMAIFKSLGLRCLTYLDEVVPFLLQVVRQCGPGLRESLLQQLSQLVSIIQFHVVPYLPTLFDIIKDYWDEHLEHVLALVQELSSTAFESVAPFIVKILPLLISSLSVPKGITAQTMKKSSAASHALKPMELVLTCCDVLGTMLLSHLHIVVPTLCKLLAQLQEMEPDTLPWQVLTIRTLKHICSGPSTHLYVPEQTSVIVSRVVHSVLKTIVISSDAPQIPSNHQIFDECLQTLCILGLQMGPRFVVFDSVIQKTIEKRGLNTAKYREFSQQLLTATFPEYGYTDQEVFGSSHGDTDDDFTGLRGTLQGRGSERMSQFKETDIVGIGSYYAGVNNNRFRSDSHGGFSTSVGSNLHGGLQKLPVNSQHLARTWDVSQRSTSADWVEWIRRLKTELLRESPSPSLRACYSLASSYLPLAHELFHAAFVSCWYELSDSYQDSLVRALQVAFHANTMSPEHLQSLLNLAEFMEHDVDPLPIDVSILAELAQKGRAYAKALHYRELEYLSSPATCFESLITINKKLDQHEAAVGILKVVAKYQRQHPNMTDVYYIQEAWLAKLGEWDESLKMYDTRLKEDPRDKEAIAGKLKCLDYLGRWEEAISLCNDSLEHMRLELAALTTTTTVISTSTDLINEETLARSSGAQRAVSPITISSRPNDKRAMRSGSSPNAFRMSSIPSPPIPSVALTTKEITNDADRDLHLFTKAAVIGARSAWALNKWGLMRSFVSQLPGDHVDSCFLKAVIASHDEDYATSANYIEQTRKYLDGNIAALLAESYGRAYHPLIMVQQCAEFEEIIDFKIQMKECGMEVLNGDSLVVDDDNDVVLNKGCRSAPVSRSIPAKYKALRLCDVTRGIRPSDVNGGSGSTLDGSASSSTPFSKLPVRSLPSNLEDCDSEQLAQWTAQQNVKRLKSSLMDKWRRRIKGCSSAGRAAIPVWKVLRGLQHDSCWFMNIVL